MIHLIDNFFSKEECENMCRFFNYAIWLIEKSTIQNDNIEIIDTNFRSSKYIRFYKDGDFRNHVSGLYKKIYEICKQLYPELNLFESENQIEDIKIIKYGKKDHFDWHYDIFANKYRNINFSILLNEDYEGGELEFFKLDVQKKIKKGTLLLYPSFIPHKVHKIKKGKRYVVIGHMSGKPFF